MVSVVTPRTTVALIIVETIEMQVRKKVEMAQTVIPVASGRDSLRFAFCYFVSPRKQKPSQEAVGMSENNECLLKYNHFIGQTEDMIGIILAQGEFRWFPNDGWTIENCLSEQ
jgi:hypothetical protein